MGLDSCTSLSYINEMLGIFLHCLLAVLLIALIIYIKAPWIRKPVAWLIILTVLHYS